MKKFMITVNGKQYEVDCEEIKDGAAPQTVTAPAAKPAEPKEAPAPVSAPAAKETPVSTGKEGSVKINAPMPGVIVRVDVAAGDSVTKGQVLLVFEAMKMENEIKAPSDGVVASVNTAKGANVNSGDLLLTLN